MSYKLDQAIIDAYDTKWSMANSFTVEIHLSDYLVGEVGQFEENINLNVVSLTTPDFNNTPIEVFAANRWIIHNGADAMYRFSMTFRDQDQMDLYRKFWTIYQLSKEQFFDAVSFVVHVTKDADWEHETDLVIMSFWGTMVENISNLSFAQGTEGQIAEFTVAFKCNQPIVSAPD